MFQLSTGLCPFCCSDLLDLSDLICVGCQQDLHFQSLLLAETRRDFLLQGHPILHLLSFGWKTDHFRPKPQDMFLASCVAAFKLSAFVVVSLHRLETLTAGCVGSL